MTLYSTDGDWRVIRRRARARRRAFRAALAVMACMFLGASGALFAATHLGMN